MGVIDLSGNFVLVQIFLQFIPFLGSDGVLVENGDNFRVYFRNFYLSDVFKFISVVFGVFLPGFCSFIQVF